MERTNFFFHFLYVPCAWKQQQQQQQQNNFIIYSWYQGSFNDWLAKGGEIERPSSPSSAVSEDTAVGAAKKPATEKCCDDEPAVSPAPKAEAGEARQEDDVESPPAFAELPKSEANVNEKDESSTVTKEGDEDGEGASARRDRERYKPQTRPADLSDILPNAGLIDSHPAARPSGSPRQRDYFTVKGIYLFETQSLTSYLFVD
jgi:hypothetical protein